MLAITREVSPSLAACELTHVARTPIDVELAASQHHAYRRALATLGCRVLHAGRRARVSRRGVRRGRGGGAGRGRRDDRPRADSRRGEGASPAQVSRGYRPLRAIKAPGTFEGGDVLRIGRTLYVGQSGRSNADGIAQLRALFAGSA